MMRIKHVKGPPLLSPPGENEGPFFEVSGRCVESMRTQLDDLAAECDWRAFTQHAAKMKKLGLDVDEETKRHKADVLRELESYVAFGNWDGFVPHAAHMKTLGFDMAETIGGNIGKLKGPLPEYRVHNDICALSIHLRSLKELDVDVSTEQRLYTGNMEGGLEDAVGTGRWWEVGYIAASMTSLGQEVPDYVERRRQEMIGGLRGYATEGNWKMFAIHSSNLHDLKMLTPNPGYSDSTKTSTLPPLRRYRRGER